MPSSSFNMTSLRSTHDPRQREADLEHHLIAHEALLTSIVATLASTDGGHELLQKVREMLDKSLMGESRQKAKSIASDLISEASQKWQS